MKYEIFTLDEKKNTRVIWGTFYFSTDKKENARFKSFLLYLQKNVSCFNSFYIREVETNKYFLLSMYFYLILDKLSA